MEGLRSLPSLGGHLRQRCLLCRLPQQKPTYTSLARSSSSRRGAAFLDLAAFFDSIRRDTLAEEAAKWHFPSSVFNLALELYAGPRHLQASDFGTRTVWARMGHHARMFSVHQAR